MTTALLCPRDRLVGFLSEDGTSALMHAPSSSPFKMVTANARHRFPDSTFVQVETDEDSDLKLSAANEQARALDFTLMLFDGQLSLATRELAAEELEELLKSEINRNYILDILLAVPLHDSADTSGSVESTSNSSLVRVFVQSILDVQERVRLSLDAWLALTSHAMVNSDNRDQIRASLVTFGVCRRLVMEGDTKAAADQVFAELALVPGFKQVCDTRILRSYVNHYKEELPKGTNRKLVVTDEKSSDSAVGKSIDLVALPGRKRTKSDDLAEWAAKQVASIADQYRLGHDTNGNRYLEELVASQTHETTDYTHIVKSLCNLSTQCGLVGREELCMPLLQRAFQYRSGIDARAYQSLADEFLRVNELDRAEQCYLQAKDLETDSSRLDAILRKCIRVAIARGNYATAMSSYEAITDIYDKAEFLTDKGTLYRRMSQFQPATQCFREAIALKADWYQAFAGIAEVHKQCGKLHRSLGAYNNILRGFSSDLDPRSKKVYQLSQAFLYQITKQFDQSHKVLVALHNQYGLDRQVNFQLGKLLVLMGRREEAADYIRESQRPDSIGLSDELFSLAFGNELDSVAQAAIKNASEYLPEDRGLAVCGSAFEAILRGSFEEAWAMISQVSHSNRLHRDFGLVLSYHARKQLDKSLSYKREQPLARIAKRGYPELRTTVQAVEQQDFELAIQSERRMLQLVA